MKINPQYRAAILSVASTILLGSSAYQLHAQTNLETFGQNRVQYRKFDWKYFDTKHFRIYHYDRAGRDLARYVAEQVENDIRVVERKMSGKFPHRFKIVVYNTYDDYRQTNIGRTFASQLQDAPAGTIDVVGDKLTVYFSGIHTDLRRQTREGMSRVIMERMLFGENFREIVRNALVSNMPGWTAYGFVSYLVDGWDAKENSDWKNILEAHPKSSFYQLAEKYPDQAGKAFWKYIADKNGDNGAKNLLYTIQSKNSLNQGVKAGLGMGIKPVFDSALNYFKTIYQQDEQFQEQPDTNNLLVEIPVPKDGWVLRNFKVSPTGSDVAYVAYRNGEYEVRMTSSRGDKPTIVMLKGGKLDYNEKQPDPDYPLLAWSNNGYKLAIMYKVKSNVLLRVYNSYNARIENYKIPGNRFDRALGLTFNEDDDKMVFSAIKKSQTDLFEFIIKGAKLKNITNDVWDDVQPQFVSGGSRRGILFLSNRTKPNLDVPLQVNELPNGPMNVFFYNTKTKRKELLQMSDVKTGNVTQPTQYGTDNYAFIYDSNGVQNQYIVEMKKNASNKEYAVSMPVTNHTRNLLAHQYNPAGNKVADVLQVGDKYKVYFKPLLIPGKTAFPKQLSPTLLKQSDDHTAKDKEARESEGNGSVMKSGSTFQSEFKEDETSKAARRRQNKINDDTGAEINVAQAADSEYLKMKAQPYKLSFKPDFLSLKLDNSVLFNRYQSMDQTGGRWINPPLSGMLAVSLNDLMEDHRITGGVRLPFSLMGSTYFMQYENAKRRVDWSLMYLRNSSFGNYNVQYIDSFNNAIIEREQLGKTVTNMLQASATYPFDRRNSIRMQMAYRNDAFRFKAQEQLSLLYDVQDKNQSWVLSRAEYVYDNSISPALNIRNGIRYKIFAEYMYRMNGKTGGFYGLGADVRNYTKIYKNFIWATRVAFAHSGGDKRIMYQMGGVDNWISPQVSQYTPIRPQQDYAFIAQANNMRGYKQNARNGNTYALINTEFRLPVLTTFMKRPIQSPLLKNLQLIAFADLGSAWQGLLPTTEKLQNNTYLPSYGSNSQVNLVIVDDTGGICLGYGGGIRTSVFGYFMRLDAASNVDDGKLLFHFSIGTDF
ncbi:MAG: hypothetical protein ACK4EY_03140 [Flavipsychrobacter sp.]